MDPLDRIRFYSSLALAFLLFVWAAFWFSIAVFALWHSSLGEAVLPLALAGVFAAASAFFWRWGLGARR